MEIRVVASPTLLEGRGGNPFRLSNISCNSFIPIRTTSLLVDKAGVAYFRNFRSTLKCAFHNRTLMADESWISICAVLRYSPERIFSFQSDQDTDPYGAVDQGLLWPGRAKPLFGRKKARRWARLFCLPQLLRVGYFFFAAFFAAFFAGAFFAAFLAGAFLAAFFAAFLTAKGIPLLVGFLLLAPFFQAADFFAAFLPLAPLLLFFAADFLRPFWPKLFWRLSSLELSSRPF